ncbi:MAG: ankyrin repeat domain-containing protein [Polyangiaceae bacterium]|nr:ankyrin repeat domain-containing protein [Polyangiaceae bacterium]
MATAKTPRTTRTTASTGARKKPVQAASANPRADQDLRNASSRGDLAAVKKALAAGASPASKDPASGYTALHDAAAQGNLPVIAALLEAGAPLEAPLRNARSTPLCKAVEDRQHDAIKVLLQAGAKVDVIHGRSSWTPLHDAVMNEDVESVRLLLAAGASPELPSQGGFTPLQQLVHMAESMDRKTVTAIVKALLAAGVDPASALKNLHPSVDASDPDVGYLFSLLTQGARPPR